MKLKYSGFIVTAAISALLAVGIVKASAAGNVEEQPNVSPALNILARELCTVKSGLCGNDVRFCADDFAETLGVGKIGRTVITSLPDASAGKLMLGSLEVMKNQTVSAENLSALRFVPSDTAERDCSFTVVTGNDRRYELKCIVRMINSLNRAPVAPNDTQTVETYRDIAVFGKMTADDPEGDELTYEIISGAEKGLLVLTDRSGGYVYTPMKGYTGKDGFSYCVTDAYGNRSEIISVGITVSRSVYGTVFEDMLGDPAHVAAITVSDAGVMSGGELNGSTLFDYDGALERAEFLTAAMKAAGYDASEIGQGTVSVFADDGDIPSGYRPFVIAAYNRGMINGDVSSGKPLFEPRGSITVSDALIMLDGILNSESNTGIQVSVGSEKSDNALDEAVSRLCAVGVTDGTADPTATLRRADAAVLLYRVLNLKRQ